MKKTIKYLLIISIITVIYVFGNYINSYGTFISGETYIRNNSQGWWCVEHGPDAANTDYEKSGPYYYTSDSTSEFERAFAYIVKNGHETGDAGYGIQDNGSHLGGGKHQLALWKLLYDFRGSNGLGTIAPFKNVQATKNVDINNPRNIGVIGVKELYDTARNQQPIAYSNNSEGAIIEAGPLKMKQDTNKGSLEIYNLVGKVSNIYIKWSDGTTANLTLNTEGKYYVPKCFGIYTNSDCTTPLNIQSINTGTIYLKNYRNNLDITDCKITVTSNTNGYRVGFYLYHNNYNQDMIQTFWEKGKPSTNTINVGVKYYGEMTIRKIDYDDNTLIDNSEFVIFEKDKGWIGYNSNNITTGNSWSNAYRFKTGTSYCGEKAYTGEFTLKKLPDGYYYIFEVATGSNLYSLKGQPGYSANSNYSFLSNDKWKMNGIESVLIGRNSCASGFTQVGLADGTPYSFYPWKNVDKNKTTDTVCDYVRLSDCNSSFEYNDKYYYATNHATLTIKNRKDTKLTIVKKDKDTNTPIANVGIKVLVKTTETRFTLNSYKWVKSDGTVTDNVNEAYEFKTDANGKIEISNVPYGKYYIFETSTSDNNYKLELQDHFMEGKPEDYKGTFLSEQYVYLGTKIIAPKTNNDLNNNNYTSNVIENDWYRIRSNLNKDYFIRPAYYGRGNNIKMITNKYETNYDWFNYRISYVNQGNYVIARRYTMGSDSDDSIELYRPISIDKAKISNNQIVEQYEYTGSDAQLWKFSKISNTTNQYNIVSKMNNGYGLHINASTPNNGTNIDIYNIQEANGKASKGSTLKFNLITNTKFGVYDANGTREITIEATNSKNENKGKLTIIKKDGSYSKDLNVNDTLRLKGAEIKIYAANLENEGTDKGWVQEIKNDNDNIEYIYSSYKDATTFKIGDTGNIELNGLFNGNYYIYETKTPTGYPIKEQPGYHKKNEGSSDLGDIDWVFLGNQKIDDQNNDVIYTASNIRYVSGGIKGKVWLDNPDGKANGYNNIYDGQDWTIQNEPISKDELKKDITVNLYSNKDGKNELIATTTTGENGEYEFKNKTNGEKLTYWELAYCYVEFIYDNKEYVLSTPFVGDNLDVNSKAQEKEVITTGREHNLGELYDGNLSGKTGDFPGKAVTYQGNVSGLNIQTIKNNETANQSQRLLTGFYNDETYTIENINLGLVKKIEPTFAIEQEIEYVKIKRGDYTFTYKMRT